MAKLSKRLKITSSVTRKFPIDFYLFIRMVHHLCDEEQKEENLYKYFNEKLISYITNNIIPKLKSNKGENLLKEFIKQWKNYTVLLHFMKKMFEYLDRYYLKNANMDSLAMQGLILYREKCFMVIKDHISHALIELIQKDRNGEVADWDLLKQAILVLVQLGFINADENKQDNDYIWRGDRNLKYYDTYFEKAFILKSKEEYKGKAAGWMASLNCPEYLKVVEENILKEEERADYFLQPETKLKLQHEISQETIEFQA